MKCQAEKSQCLNPEFICMEEILKQYASSCIVLFISIVKVMIHPWAIHEEAYICIPHDIEETYTQML